MALRDLSDERNILVLLFSVRRGDRVVRPARVVSMDGWAQQLEAPPVAVVTGASRGIGRAIAVALGKAGCNVLQSSVTTCVLTIAISLKSEPEPPLFSPIVQQGGCQLRQVKHGG